jgi:hypothetical protein
MELKNYKPLFCLSGWEGNKPEPEDLPVRQHHSKLSGERQEM